MTPEKVLAALSARSESSVGGANLEVRRFRRFNIREVLQPVIEPDWPRDDKTGRLINYYPPIETASGRQTEAKRQTGSMAEFAADALGSAQRQMSRTSWNAILCVLGIDDEAERIIRRKLHKKALIDKKRSKDWPDKIPRRPCECKRSANPDYLVDMVTLAIIEQQAPSLLRANWQRAEWLGVSERTFERHLIKPYQAVAGHLNTWFESGIGFICGQLQRMRADSFKNPKS